MARTPQIQKFVQRHHGFIPKTGWIADVITLPGRIVEQLDLGPCVACGTLVY
jgi:hypothetical protein